MKEKIIKKIFVIVLLVFQLLQIIGSIVPTFANIKEGDVMLLEADHECNSLVEYWMEKEQRWSYKVVWYVYYTDPETNIKYPAFCVEPAKNGVGMGYDSYNVTIEKEEDNRIWRILDKGYMGSNYQNWQLECDDDLYTATKIALHSLKEGVEPKNKYILGTRSVDGNTVEEIQRRGAKALEVAQTLYEYGINGTETYVGPEATITKQGEREIKTIDNTSYYIQNYKVAGNKNLKSYEVEIQNFPIGTKIFNSNYQEKNNFTEKTFHIAIPIKQIKEDINGDVIIKNAEIKTNPIFHCKSSIESAQSYVTYVSGYEKASTKTTLEIKANEASLQIRKVDSQTKKPISNVTFEIKDEKQNKIAEVVTNQNGIAELKGIYPQTVTVKEINVPEPYVLSTEEKQVELEWGKVSSVTFENQRKKGNLKITKVDSEDNKIKLENVEFELLDNKGNIVKKLVTNNKGEAYAENLEIGKYTLREIKTNENYVLSEKEIPIEIKYNETVTLKLENEKIKGQIKIIKISQEDNLRNGDLKGSPIEGVTFEIRNKNDEVVDILITNEEGIAISKELEKGIYTIREIKTNIDYEITDEEFVIEIVEHKKTEEITVTNIPKKPDEPEKPTEPKLPRTGF